MLSRSVNQSSNGPAITHPQSAPSDDLWCTMWEWYSSLRQCNNPLNHGENDCCERLTLHYEMLHFSVADTLEVVCSSFTVWSAYNAMCQTWLYVVKWRRRRNRKDSICVPHQWNVIRVKHAVNDWQIYARPQTPSFLCEIEVVSKLAALSSLEKEKAS